MKENIHGSFGVRVKKDWKRNRSLYIMFIPVVLFYVLFMYKPMYGVIISFMDYAPAKGIWGSKWVGLKHFERFFTGPYFGRLLRNTLLLSLYSIMFCFTTPIILALLLNEVHCKKYKSVAQTLSYLPHFVSMVVTAGIIKEFCMSDGLLNDIIVLFGGSRSALLQRPELYRTIYIVSDIWQEIGWGSIIYLAALAGIDQQLYEAAEIDGANRWNQFRYIIIPAIRNILFLNIILSVSGSLSVFEVPYIMTGGANGTMTFVIQTVQTAFNYNQVGLASAMAVILFLIVVLVSAAQFILTQARSDAKKKAGA